MSMPEWIDPTWYEWVILPTLIAIARVMDVTVGTIRLIFVARGYKYMAPMLGFVEVIIWLMAISQIMQHLGNFMSYIGYGAGFALGNYIGIVIVEKMSIGTVLIRLIPRYDTTALILDFRKTGFGITKVAAEGKDGPVNMLYSIVKRKQLPNALAIINKHNPQAFYTIEEVQKVNEGYFSPGQKQRLFAGGVFGTHQIRK